MTTSKNFDTQPKAIDFPYFRTFDELIGFNKKNKKRRFDKVLKEEWEIDPETGKGYFVSPAEAKAKKKAASDSMFKGKHVRDLDKEPLRAKPFKNDTFFTVNEIAKYCWEHSSELKGRYEEKKDFIADLKKNKKLRDLCNFKMIQKLGKNKAALETKVTEKIELEKDPYKIADYFFNHPTYKKWFSDLKSVKDLRRMIIKDPKQGEKLALIMYNENNKK